MIETTKNTLNNKIDTLNLLVKNLNKVTYHKIQITSNNLIKKHTDNLSTQAETFRTLVNYLEEFSEFINALKKHNILNFYEELMQLQDIKNKIKINKELNISNYISLISLNHNKNLNTKINNFYLKISNIIYKINYYYEEENKINDVKNKLTTQKQQINQKLNSEKQNINIQIEKFQEELNKTSQLKIFKRDKIKSDIDLLNQELILYKKKEIQLEKDYNEKIAKENNKLNKLKETIK